MRLSLLILSVIFILSSCGNSKEKGIQDVITNYCNANSNKKPKDIVELIYPDVFNSQKKSDVEQFYYTQLATTDVFQIKDIKFLESSTLLDDSKEDEVFFQKYTMNTTVGLDVSTQKNEFGVLKEIALKSDKNAVINEETLTVTFQDKKKIIVVKTQDQQFYILPNIFLNEESASKFDFNKVKEGLTTP